jgi:pimeloyl-ACP methyl ester carboxylesterase
VRSLFLIHGGLWEDMDAERFWRKPGIVAGLERDGFVVVAPDRVRTATSWHSETEHVAAALPDDPVVVIAGSNGCSVAVRLALARPDRVDRLVLAWPATAGDTDADARTGGAMAVLGATADVVDAMLTGDTLRGVTDDELRAVTVPVGVLPSSAENPYHQRRTVDALLSGLPDAVELPACPEPPRPDFPNYAESFIRTIGAFARQ